jgi:hypothetical protein
MHEGIAYNAMVSVRTTPFFMEYTITMLDESIAEQLPNNKIISTSKDSFVFSDSTSENSKELMEQILQAVSSHMQALHT